MPRLINSALSLRRDPRLLKLPPYLSGLCILIGVVWLLLLPLDEYSRNTYISENALLPGQVHTYFGGSDQNVLRAYKREVAALANSTNTEVNDALEGIFKSVGLKVGRQNFTYTSCGEVYAGENLYAILQAPRGDATEAIVLVAAWTNMNDDLNENGVALALTLSRYFKRWSLWSKDIIILITPDSLAGPQAWVDAYHDAHNSRTVASLPLKSGALQGAVAIDYTQKERFSAVHIVYDGVNGQLPNLDLINSVVNIADGQMGMGATIQDMWKPSEGYKDRLQTVLRGMMKQGLGVGSGPHSSFIPYHVDAVTIQPYGEGWQDEMAMGRLVEGTFRSLNNLLEKLHQSFFFYLLMDRNRFVSIGTYLPSAMLIAANFTIMAIALWVKSGTAKSAAPVNATQKLIEPAKDGEQTAPTTTPESTATAPAQAAPTAERDLFLPLGIVALCQFLGVVPLYLFNHLPVGLLNPAFLNFTIFNAGIPILISGLLAEYKPPTPQQYYLIKSFSLLLLGMFLSALATLNYSLAFFVGLLAAPLSFMRPWPNNEVMRWVSFGVLFLASPPVVAAIGALAWGVGIEEVLTRAAFGWDVWGMYTAVVVWCVWWPAWLAAGVVVLGTPGERAVDVEKKNA